MSLFLECRGYKESKDPKEIGENKALKAIRATKETEALQVHRESEGSQEKAQKATIAYLVNIQDGHTIKIKIYRK
jgi:hypothetical protein